MPSIQADLYYTFLAAVISLTLILSVFAFSIFHHLRRKRIQLRAKSYQDECNMESDRKRIAADLHDDFGSLLTGLRLSLSELSQSGSSGTLLNSSTGLLDQSILRLKEISLNLVPRELEKEGLHAAIATFVERINKTGRLQLQYAASFDDSDFETEKAMLIFRIIQELTTNTIKHSGGSKIDLAMATRGNLLIVEFRDNGNGFDYDAALQKKESSGLKNIRSRLDLLSAILMVDSKIGEGTHYFIKISLRHLNKRPNE